MSILIITGHQFPANQVDFMPLPGEVIHPPLGMNAGTIGNIADLGSSIPDELKPATLATTSS